MNVDVVIDLKDEALQLDNDYADITRVTKVTIQRQSSPTRGRGSKKLVINSRYLVRHSVATEGSAVKPKSFLSEALMSSIFAWNMHVFNKPCKQKAVQYWVKAVKLSFLCLIETKVKEENFQKVFNTTFPG